MFSSKKIQTVGTISEFLNKKEGQVHHEPKLKSESGNAFHTLLPLALSPVFLNNLSVPTFAAESVAASAMSKTEITNQITKAFDPINSLVYGLATPLTLIILTAAGIYYLAGNKPKAMDMLQNAAIGYILVSIAPLILKLLIAITAGF